MESSAAIWLVLLVAAVAANLPFVNERLFLTLAFPGFVWRYLRRRRD